MMSPPNSSFPKNFQEFISEQSKKQYYSNGLPLTGYFHSWYPRSPEFILEAKVADPAQKQVLETILQNVEFNLRTHDTLSLVHIYEHRLFPLNAFLLNYDTFCSLCEIDPTVNMTYRNPDDRSLSLEKHTVLRIRGHGRGRNPAKIKGYAAIVPAIMEQLNLNAFPAIFTWDGSHVVSNISEIASKNREK